MKTRAIIQTAQTNLIRTKVRTILTITAVFIGTFTLVMTTAFTQGVRQYIYIQLHAYGQENSLSIVGEGNKEVRNPLHMADITKVLQTPHIQSAYPDYSINLDNITYGSYSAGSGAGIVTSYYPDIHPDLSAGLMPSVDDTSAIVLPYDALSLFHFAAPNDAIGKRITLHISNPLTHASKTYDVNIKAVLVNTIHGQPGSISYKLMKDLYAFQTGNPDTFSAIYATTTNNLSTTNLNIVKADLANDGFSVTSFQDQISRLNQVITFMQLGTGAFAGISLLVGCICIINTLLMAVLERTQEIGLLKALGMRRREIFSIFAYEAASIGFWGGLSAVVFGVLLGPILNALIQHAIPNAQGVTLIIYPPVIMVMIVIGATLIGLLAGILPALRAAKLDPIVALRHE